MTETTGWLHAGRVGSPHGLDGSFHVSEPRPDLLALGARIALGARAALGARVVVGAETLEIVRRAGTDRRPILRLEGCEDRSAAERLRGSELLVPREQAPPLEPDEWWAEDLEGCSVHDSGTAVGTVRRLLELPSCEVLEVEREGRADLLVPLIADAVRSVDIERHEIDISLEFLGEG